MSFESVFACFVDEPTAMITIEMSDDSNRWIDIDAADIALDYGHEIDGTSIVAIHLDELCAKPDCRKRELTLIQGGRE